MGKDLKPKTIKPPLGLVPRKNHEHNVKVNRFNEVQDAIARYYAAQLKINPEWIEEYNELIDYITSLKENESKTH